MVKIRISSDSKLHPFETRAEAFKWVKSQYKRCTVSVLTYNNDELEDLTRFHYNGTTFVKEILTN